jgi:hypothetical protein
LRFNRDVRGYETTALVQAGGRRRGKGQRLLYFFRTPPGVRVGRAPIDEEAIRLLEQNNPDVDFDWTQILKAPSLQEGQPRRPEREHRERRREARPQAQQQPRPQPFQLAPVDRVSSGRDAGPHEADAPVDVSPMKPATAPIEMDADPDMAGTDSSAGQPAADTTLQASDSGAPLPYDPADARPEDAGSASYARLGAEGLGRLRARYSEVLARIAEKPIDEEARGKLKLDAERLNPDAWVTADEVSQALEQYETVFESLRAVVGRNARRRRRRV